MIIRKDDDIPLSSRMVGEAVARLESAWGHVEISRGMVMVLQDVSIYICVLVCLK